MQLPKEVMDADAKQFYLAQSHDFYGLHFRNWSHYASEEEHVTAESIIRDPAVFKWAIVRHPWARLVSGYRSKYEGSCNFDRICLRNTWKVPVDRKGGIVTFHEFVEALGTVPPASLNGHFRPAYLLCELNRIPYDFIGELKSKEDTDYISMRIGYPKTFSEVERSEYNSKSYYGGRTNQLQNCTRETVAAAERLYAGDSAILGFDFKDAYFACEEYGKSQIPVYKD